MFYFFSVNIEKVCIELFLLTPRIYCDNFTDGILGNDMELPDSSAIFDPVFIKLMNEGRQYMIIIPTNNTVTISTIDIYIYNYPSKQYGVPNFSLYRTSRATTLRQPSSQASELEFDLINNDKLSQNDSGIVHKVTLRLRMPTTLMALLIRWSFDEVNVRYFNLSEVVLCADDILPDYFTQSITFITPEAKTTTIKSLSKSKLLTLTCTVSMQGSFEWRWKFRSANVTESPFISLWKADGTRTSILNIHNFFCDYAGTYICEVRFSGVTEVYSRMFDVSFQSKQTINILSPFSI